jgi:hypothetical protein
MLASIAHSSREVAAKYDVCWHMERCLGRTVHISACRFPWIGRCSPVGETLVVTAVINGTLHPLEHVASQEDLADRGGPFGPFSKQLASMSAAFTYGLCKKPGRLPHSWIKTKALSVRLMSGTAAEA